MSKINLIPDQLAAIAYMHDFVAGPDSMMVLEGFAGTGKTTCIQQFAKEFKGEIAFTAPYNKAVKVLRQMANEAGNDRITCVTIYSLLGLLMNDSTRKRQVVADGQSKIEDFDLVVVDEGSTINKGVIQHLREAVANCRVKIIFMADRAQLPPIEDKGTEKDGDFSKAEDSEIFSLTNKVQLTKVMRHDNQILNLATHIRRCLFEGETLKLESDNDEKGGIYISNGKKFIANLQKGFTSARYKSNPEAVKTVAWRNTTVDAHNEHIRAAMYGNDVGPEFQIGERIVACSVVNDLLAKVTSGDIVRVLSIDEEATVVSISEADHPIYRGILCYAVTIVREPEMTEHLCYVIHPKGRRDADKLFNRLAEAAGKGGSWSAFWQAKDCFHDLRPCHAITAHRAQGSTYDTVFVNAYDIMAMSKYDEVTALKCLYVAVTRASRIVVLKVK